MGVFSATDQDRIGTVGPVFGRQRRAAAQEIDLDQMYRTIEKFHALGEVLLPIRAQILGFAQQLNHATSAGSRRSRISTKAQSFKIDCGEPDVRVALQQASRRFAGGFFSESSRGASHIDVEPFRPLSLRFQPHRERKYVRQS